MPQSVLLYTLLLIHAYVTGYFIGVYVFRTDFKMFMLIPAQ